jgi:hypothetical protein
MSFEPKKQETKHRTPSAPLVKTRSGNTVRRQSPVIQHYRVVGNMTVQRMKKDEENLPNVNIYPNSSKAPALGAIAYTQGNDIHFAPGAYNPGTGAGKQLLGHELAHVVQQRQGRVQPTTRVNGLPVNDNPALEKEADAMAKKLV